MRTTIRLDDAFLARAKKEALRRGKTLTALIEEGLRMVMAQGEQSVEREPVRLPVSSAGGGTLPGVDLKDSARLLEIMESPIDPG